MDDFTNDPDFIDLVAAWDESIDLSPERSQELLNRLAEDERLRHELAREVQMAGLTRTVQSGEPRWLKLEEKMETAALSSEPAQTEAAVMEVITRRLNSPSVPSLWLKQVAMIAIGLVIGLFGAGVVWAIQSPKALTSLVNIVNGDFEDLSGPISSKLPVQYNEWGGDPAEVVVQEGGNRVLRFVQTARNQNEPGSFAGSCDVVHLLDLRSLRRELGKQGENSELSIEMTATFQRDASDTENAQEISPGGRLMLFDIPPEAIAQSWPSIGRESLAGRGHRGKPLNPGDHFSLSSGSCILPPEATVAMIRLSATLSEKSSTSVPLGDCYVDDVQITVTSRPNLPIRKVKIAK